MLLAAHWTGNVDPVAFTIGDIEIAWYGIIITCAMLTGLIVAILRGKKQGLVVDDFVEIFLLAIPLAIIGARIGYVMVRPEYFPSDFTWDDFVNVIAVWDGGLTIMTGVPFGILGGAIWCKIRKVNLLDLADVIVPVILLSQGLGRWGNFCNQEIFGPEITDPALQWFPLAVYINRLGGFYQALFFYEMVLDIAFFAAMMIIQRHLKLRGSGLLMYAFSYGLIRFVMEFFRDDGDIYAVFNYTQVISIIVAIAALAILIALIVVKKKKGEKIWYGKDGIPDDEKVKFHPYHRPQKKSADK